jgi:hypothetical protein
MNFARRATTFFIFDLPPALLRGVPTGGPHLARRSKHTVAQDRRAAARRRAQKRAKRLGQA